MIKTSTLYEGKTKIAYLTDDENILLEFKDDITAFDGKKHEILQGKGRINALISARLFELLNASGIRTHYFNFVEPKSILVKKLNMIKLEVTCRNIATGSLTKRLPFKEKEVLESPIIEYYYKSDEYHDPIINSDHVKALELANETELEEMRNSILKANTVLQKFLLNKEVLLVDFKLEFGRDSQGQLFIGDEISPDSCRFWDKTTLRSLDKDVFRRGELDVMEVYQEIFRRIVGEWLEHIAEVLIELKPGLIDPEGKAIHKALNLLGYQNVKEVKSSKQLKIKLEVNSKENAKKLIDEMCRRLLANPIIHNYTITVKEAK